LNKIRQNFFYKNKNMTRTVIVDALKRTDYGTQVNIKGWVRTRRGNKNVSFIALNDGSTINNIQVVADNEKFGDEYLKPITTGACISVTGTIVESLGKGQTVEIQADEIQIYGSADLKLILYKRKGIRSSSFARLPICVRVQTLLELFFAFVTTWPWRCIAFFTIVDFSIFIRLLLPLRTVKEPVRCFR